MPTTRYPSASEFIPPRPTLPRLRGAAQGCRGCDLYEGATQTVFGEGLKKSKVMFVGEHRVPGLGQRAAALRQRMVDERLRHRAYTREYGDDPADVRDWTWR